MGQSASRPDPHARPPRSSPIATSTSFHYFREFLFLFMSFIRQHPLYASLGISFAQIERLTFHYLTLREPME